MDWAAPPITLMARLEGQQTIVVPEGEQPGWTENILKPILLLYLL